MHIGAFVRLALFGAAWWPVTSLADASLPANSVSPPAEVAALERRCEAGHDPSCHALVERYRYGQDVKEDRPRAQQIAERACRRGRGRTLTCTDAGNGYLDGWGVVKNALVAHVFLVRACDGGEPGACAMLGLMHTEGLGVPYDLHNKRTGVRYYERACRGGHAGGCVHLGWLVDEGIGTKKDPARARALFKRACQAGDAVGCDELKKRRTDARPLNGSRSAP